MNASTTPPVHTNVPPPAHTPAPVVPPVVTTPAQTVDHATLTKQKQASWGAIVIIVLILGMVVVGAFYAWGKRIAENQQPTTSQTQ